MFKYACLGAKFHNVAYTTIMDQKQSAVTIIKSSVLDTKFPGTHIRGRQNKRQQSADHFILQQSGF